MAGEPVAVVVANKRAVAEDASELVEIDYEDLDAQLDMETAMDKSTKVIHDDLGNNLFGLELLIKVMLVKHLKISYCRRSYS